MKRCLMATLATVTLVMGLTSLVGCGGNKGVVGPRGSEEATIRVRNGSVELELRDEPDAEWEQDADTLEWTQKGRSRPGPDLDIVIKTTATCNPLPNNPKSVRVVHADGTTVELKLHQQKTRAKVFVVFQSTAKILKYAPSASRDDFIKEIWVKNSLICTFTNAQQLEYMDLKR